MSSKSHKFISLMLAVCMLLSVNGCSDGKKGSSDSEKDEPGHKQTVETDVSDKDKDESDSTKTSGDEIDASVSASESELASESETITTESETQQDDQQSDGMVTDGIPERFTKLPPEDQEYIAQNGVLTRHEAVTADNLEWSVDEASGTLYINGTGPMKDYFEEAPGWADYADSVHYVVVSDGITTIGSMAFYDLGGIIHADIPDSVEYIGMYAFAYNSNMDEIPMPASLKEIDEGAFMEVKVHKPLTISDGVEIIHSRAFWANDFWYTISIPASVYYIEEDAFSNGLGVTEFAVDPANQYYCSSDGVLFDKDMKLLMNYPLMKQDAEYSIPETVTRLGNHAFDINFALETLTISASVDDIGEGNFRCLYALKEIKVDDGNSALKTDCGVLLSMDGKILYTFPKLLQLEEYTIPEGVEKICSEAFFNTAYLKTLTLPESGIKLIDMCAFSEMNGAAIVIPASLAETVEFVDSRAFVYYTKYDTAYYLYDGYDKETNSATASVTIPWEGQSITFIGSQAQWDAFAAKYNLYLEETSVIISE